MFLYPSTSKAFPLCSKIKLNTLFGSVVYTLDSKIRGPRLKDLFVRISRLYTNRPTSYRNLCILSLWFYPDIMIKTWWIVKYKENIQLMFVYFSIYQLNLQSDSKPLSNFSQLHRQCCIQYVKYKPYFYRKF